MDRQSCLPGAGSQWFWSGWNSSGTGELIFPVERTLKRKCEQKKYDTCAPRCCVRANSLQSFSRVSLSKILEVDGLLGWWVFRPTYHSGESAGLSV
jgi:hypothetical protein